MVTVSKRLEGIGEYYFSQKLAEIAEINKQGKPLLTLVLEARICHRTRR
jgi:hypothetical protein